MIKFRGLTEENIWIYGDYVRYSVEYDDAMWEEQSFISNINSEYSSTHQVDEKSIGQFIHQYDHDGAELYVEDIVRLVIDGETVVGYIDFDSNDFMSSFVIVYNDSDIWTYFDDVELIGNIFENSELLDVL